MHPFSHVLLSSLRTASMLLVWTTATPTWAESSEQPPARTDFPDPTSWSMVLFPGAMPSVYALSEDEPQMSRPLGWHIPGRNFKSGEGWWALACRKICTITTTKLSASPRQHPDYDGPLLPGQLLVWSPLPYGLDIPSDPNAISAPPRDAVLIALFKPLRSLAAMQLAPGPIKTWLHAGMESYPRPDTEGAPNVDGTTIATRIPLDAQEVAVLMPLSLPRSEAEKQRMGDGHDGDLVFELRAYGQRQRLGGYQWDIEGPKALAGPQYLLWAGDLDSDNKLDLLMSFQGRGWDTVLFLSSLAKPGELVGEAGRFNYWPPNDPGC